MTPWARELMAQSDEGLHGLVWLSEFLNVPERTIYAWRARGGRASRVSGGKAPPSPADGDHNFLDRISATRDGSFLRLQSVAALDPNSPGGGLGRPVAGGLSRLGSNQVESPYGGSYVKVWLAVCTGFAVSALLLIPAGSASAHVHGITPLPCIPQEPTNAGANQNQ